MEAGNSFSIVTKTLYLNLLNARIAAEKKGIIPALNSLFFILIGNNLNQSIINNEGPYGLALGVVKLQLERFSRARVRVSAPSFFS